jgi:hypothetical protein
MRYALSGSLTVLSFSLTNALKVDQPEGCAAVVTHTHYVYATAEPSVSSSAGGSGSYGAGSNDAKISSGGAASEGFHGYATADASTAVKPSISSECSDSTTTSSSKATVSTGPSAATGYWSSYGVGVSSAGSYSNGVSPPAGSYANGISTPEGSYVTVSSSSVLIETGSSSAQGASSTGASAASGYWSSYGVPSTNTTAAGGAFYPTGASYAAGVSTFSTSIVVASSGVSSAPTVFSTDASVVSSTEILANSSANSSAVSSTDSSAVSSTASSTISSTVSSLASATVLATATGIYGPNVIPDGHFDGEATPSDWVGSRKNVGEQAQSGTFVLSAKANKESYYAAHFSYAVGPLNWKGKYHLSFYHQLATALPEGVECSLSVGMGADGLTKVKLTASDASRGWQRVEVDDIPINSAINELSFDYYCDDNQFFEDGGEVEFLLDTVDMYEQIPPVTTASQVCSTSAPTGTPGPNMIQGGTIYQPSVGSTLPNWNWQRVTTVKDVGDSAHSSPYVLASRIDEILPFASILITIEPRSLAVKYTISLWVRFVYTNMPENSIPTLATNVGAYQVDRHLFKASDIEKGWTNILIKDVSLEEFGPLDQLEFNFFDYAYPGQLVRGGELEYWLDDVEMYEQAPEIVTCS